MIQEKTRRCCGTCRHRTPIGTSIPYACAGCIQCGECTKWQPLEAETDQEEA